VVEEFVNLDEKQRADQFLAKREANTVNFEMDDYLLAIMAH
jgi:hypothetical protein